MSLRRALLVVAAGAAIGWGALSAGACETVVSWKAPLLPASVVPAAQSPASGLASFDFALDRPQATITLDTTGLKNVTEIDLCRGFVGSNGPVVAHFYRISDGPLPAHLVKTIAAGDVVPSKSLHLATFTDLAAMIVNGGVYMQVFTREHPAGELRGQVSMVKRLVYSATDDGSGHDPRLHAAY